MKINKKIFATIVALVLISAVVYAGNIIMRPGNFYVDGNVGIGTTDTDPDAKLHIESSDNYNIGVYSYVNGINSIGVRGYGKSKGIYGLSTDGVGVYGESTNGYAGYFDGKGYFSGNVGIGTVSPSAKLDVEVSSGGAATIGGSGNSATGDYAVAMGQTTKASGDSSTAMGASTRASGIGSTAIGVSTLASGIESTAMGYLTNASGTASTTMGRGTTASGQTSTAIGDGTTASGGYSTAMGYDTTAKGWGSTAMGYSTTASGDYSTAMGLGTTASGGYSTAMGREIEASGQYSVAIALNDQNGININQANTMAIMGGNVGIGDTTPDAKLDVNGSAIIDDDLSVEGDASIDVRSNSALTVQDGATPFLKVDTINNHLGFLTTIMSSNSVTIGDTNDAVAFHMNGVDDSYFMGNVGIGDQSPEAKLHIYNATGRLLRLEGTSTDDDCTQGADPDCSGLNDFAELMPSAEELESGDVVVINSDSKKYRDMIKKGTKPYDTSVVGIVSTKPAIIIEGNAIVGMGSKYEFDGKKPPIAMAGRVAVKATIENGPIEKGDLLTTSSKPGYAMRFTLLNPEDANDFGELKSILKENEQRRNSILGKALEPLNGSRGKVMALVTLQ